MSINSINSFSPSIAPLQSTERATPKTATGDGSFGSAVKSALDSLDSSQKSAEQEIGRSVTGESPDLHKTIIALQSADLSFQFALQVRNKVIGAYEEIMRMQV